MAGYSHYRRPTTWRLWNTDTWEHIESGHEIDGDITEAFGGNWVEAQAPGMLDPLQQWTSGRQKTVSLDLFFFAEMFFEEIISKVNLIKRWAELDPHLSPPRVPRLLLDYGEAFQIPCKLEAVGALRWEGRLRDDGTPRIARIPVSLRRWIDSIQYEPTDPTKPEASTIYHTVQAGQTFEHIAARRYGPDNAILGVLLRQDNPDKVHLAEGQTIEVPDLDKLSDRIVAGTFPLFAGSSAAGSVLETHWDLRSGQTESIGGGGNVATDTGVALLPVLFGVGS